MRIDRLRPGAAGFLAIVAFGQMGCNSMLVGDWEAGPIPKDAPFQVIQAKFTSEGLYQATAEKDGEVVKLRGTYDFNGLRLTLRSAGKPPRSYRASCWLGKYLKIKHNNSRLTMRKQ